MNASERAAYAAGVAQGRLEALRELAFQRPVGWRTSAGVLYPARHKPGTACQPVILRPRLP